MLLRGNAVVAVEGPQQLTAGLCGAEQGGHRMASVSVTSSATCTAFHGVDANTGELVAGGVLAERVGWLAALSQQMAAKIVADHWNAAGLAVVAAGVGADGRRWPANGWMVLRRLGWCALPPAGVVVSDRVRRMAEEQAARALRLAVSHAEVVAAVLAAWPADPARRTAEEWSMLRVLLPAGTRDAIIGNRTRQVASFLAELGQLPKSICNLGAPPTVAREVLLGAADRQQVCLTRRGNIAVLKVLLPTTPTPRAYGGWSWVAFATHIPANVPANAELCSPTLRSFNDRARVDLPRRLTTPVAQLKGHVGALATAWGISTLLTAVEARLTKTATVSTTGRPLRFDAPGVATKLVRLRLHREKIAAKVVHLTALIEECPDPVLAETRDRLAVEHEHICSKIRHVNRALSMTAGRWLVDHVVGAGATVIYLEDLATLEAGGRSKSLNAKISSAVRGSILTDVRHLALKVSIAVVTVPTRGSSKLCPRCNSLLTHTTAPDTTIPGYRWAHCQTCGFNADRDHAEREKLANRGLTGQTKTYRDRAGCLHIRGIVDPPVTRRRRRRKSTHRTIAPLIPPPPRDRAKTGPTPRQAIAAHLTATPAAPSRLVPSRRQVPALTTAPAVVGQRPAGQTPKSSTAQVLHTATHAPRPRHRVRGAVFGRGFHHHVRATPPDVIWLGITGV